MGEMEGLADNRVFEKRFLEQDSDSARDGVDDGGCVGGAGVIGNEETSAGRNAFDAADCDADADCTAEEHGAAGSGPIESVGILDDDGVNEQRDTDDDDVEGKEDSDEECAEHGRV